MGSPDPKARAPEAPPARGVPIGSLDVLEAFVGARGQGKSTFLCQQVADLVEDVGGAYVIGHSMGARLPERLPDGPRLPIDYHENVDAMARALRRNPNRWHIVASSTQPADPVIHYARRLSHSMREGIWRREHPLRPFNDTRRLDGKPMIPIVVIIDEGIAVDAADGRGGSAGHEETKWFRAWLFSLRHEHIAVFYAIQNANARSYLVIDQATAVHAFKTRHEWALSAIRAGAGATQEQLERIRSLPRYERLTFR